VKKNNNKFATIKQLPSKKGNIIVLENPCDSCPESKKYIGRINDLIIRRHSDRILIINQTSQNEFWVTKKIRLFGFNNIPDRATLFYLIPEYEDVPMEKILYHKGIFLKILAEKWHKLTYEISMLFGPC